MKTKLVLIIVFVGLSAIAQTNIFPQLLSPTNAVLMTNAEFRCYSGNKLFFKNDVEYRAFHAVDLSTNVLDALGTSAEKLDAQQKALDEAKANFKIQAAAYQAEQVRLQQVAAQQKIKVNAQIVAWEKKVEAENHQRWLNGGDNNRNDGLTDNQHNGAYIPH